MKKGLKIVLVIVLILVLLVVADLISIFTRNKPLLYLNSEWTAEKPYMVYKSAFYNVYVCDEDSKPEIKAKWTEFSCPVVPVDGDKTNNN